MKLLSRIWLPAAVATVLGAQMAPSDAREEGMPSGMPAPVQDTVIYPQDGYRRFWDPDEVKSSEKIDDSLTAGGALGFGEEDEGYYSGRPAALDSLTAPDSLRLSAPFRYKYFAALSDSLSHVYIRDSLINAGDSLDWPVLDSLYAADSVVAAKLAFQAWYASLSKTDRKKYDAEQLAQVKLARMDSIAAVKDSIKAYKDSVLENTPRILESYVFRDSLRYRRILSWTHDRDFHNVRLRETDTAYNYRYYDFPFERDNPGGVWLGISGSPVLPYDITKRKREDGVYFYDALSSWTYTPETLPMYNTKTPYTELSYTGSLLTGSSKGSDNLHLLTSQNITPAFNITLMYERFGAEGNISNETTANKTTTISANYTGKRYLAHAGIIRNKVKRSESGGITDNMWIRDTTVDSREIAVALSDASSQTVKTTFFIDQQYRIPLSAFKEMGRKVAALASGKGRKSAKKEAPGEDGGSEAQADLADDSAAARADADGPEAAGGNGIGEDADDPDPEDNMDMTTAFIGHSSDWSVYTRSYNDNLTTTDEKSFYGNVFNYNPVTSADSMRVTKLDNKVFLRLQPWRSEAVVSKLDVGVGEKLMHYWRFDPSYLSAGSSAAWHSTYVYAGINGMLGANFRWDALAHSSLIGQEAGDFDICANTGWSFFPFRKARTSPVTIGLHFESSLKEPDWYTQHMMTNHYSWEGGFDKTSTTRVSGSISIPRWNMDAEVTYSLLADNIWYDTLSVARQNSKAMSVIGVSLNKNFVIGKTLHLDNRVLLQYSSDKDVLPLPMIALNARYYVQMTIAKVLSLQAGVSAWYTDSWYSQAWNPALGVFYNQKEQKYGNAPVFDAFVNMQWKRACIFVKWENVGMGWPLDHADYFTAHHYIRPQRSLKFGIFWPFYTQDGSKGGHSAGGGDSSSPGGSGGLQRASD